MRDWPVGLSTGSFYQRSLFDCLEIIAHGGFSIMEISSAPHHLDYHDRPSLREAARRIRELGLEAYSFHAPFKGLDFSSPDQGLRMRSSQELLMAAEAGADLQARYLVTHPGPEEARTPSPSERLERMNRAAEALNQASRRCQQLGLGLTLENMLPHLLFGDMREMLWLMGAMEDINLGACLDTGHAFLSGEMDRLVYRLQGQIRLIHVSDNQGKEDEHLAPGKGKIPWEGLLRSLHRTGFHGGLILELAGGGLDDKEMIAQAQQGRRLLRTLGRGLA